MEQLAPKGVFVSTIMVLELTGLLLTAAARAWRIAVS